jgi:hypothetical protein
MLILERIFRVAGYDVWMTDGLFSVVFRMAINDMDSPSPPAGN